jgi:hypothetical protein
MADSTTSVDGMALLEGDALKEVCRQGEECLRGTVQLAIASDQRASTLTGIFIAGTVALVVAAGNWATGTNPSREFISALLATAAMFGVAAFLVARAARSIDYHVAGYEPRALAVVGNEHVWMLRYSADEMQEKIDFNRMALEKASRALTMGRAFGFWAAPTGIAVYFFMTLEPLSFFLNGTLRAGLGGWPGCVGAG